MSLCFAPLMYIRFAHSSSSTAAVCTSSPVPVCDCWIEPSIDDCLIRIPASISAFSTSLIYCECVLIALLRGVKCSVVWRRFRVSASSMMVSSNLASSILNWAELTSLRPDIVSSRTKLSSLSMRHCMVSYIFLICSISNSFVSFFLATWIRSSVLSSFCFSFCSAFSSRIRSKKSWILLLMI